MRYVVFFTDNSDQADARKRLMPAHLNFLEQHRNHIRAAGPFRDTDSNEAGGLWLVDAESRESVTDLVHQDPLWPTGLRKSVRVLQWSQVFADGRRVT
jgi:uncharacterized protein YciI